MSERSKPRKVADLITRRLSDDETAVIVPTGSAVVLNEVGAVVLDLCDGTRTSDEIVDLLCETMKGATRERVVADVRTFVDLLASSGCVVDAS